MNVKTISFVVGLSLACSWTVHAASARWSTFKSNILGIQISVPSDWQPVKVHNALAFKYEDISGVTAGLGIMKSSQTSNIEQAAEAEFKREGRPADWQKMPANLSGMRAIKIVGTDPKRTTQKFVHYYVETPQGNYLVQCQATRDRWATFSPIFTTILTKMKFLQSVQP